jgi:hypothetical protein
MAAYYEQSVPMSKLSAKSELASSDILLVSEYNTESDSLYYTDQVTAGRYGEMISAQFGVQDLKDSTYDISAKIQSVSADYLSVRNDLDALSAAFLSNDELTRKVPELSAKKDSLSSSALSTLRLERVIYHGEGDLGRFYLSAFAVNECRPHGVSMLRFVIPPEMHGLSRHFTIRVSSDIDTIPVFVGDRVIFMTEELPARLPANKETFYDFKEVRPNGFYVRTGVPPNAYEFDSKEVAVVYHSNF